MNIFQELCFSPGLIWLSCSLLLQHREVWGACPWKSHQQLQSLALCSLFTKQILLFWRKLQREKGRKGIFQLSLSIDSFWLFYTECKGRDSVTDTWQPFFCAGPGDGGQGRRRRCQWSRGGDQCLFSLSRAHPYCLGFPETADCWFGCLSFVFVPLQCLWLFGLSICIKEYTWLIMVLFPELARKE